ncbi:SH3 domain-containing protein [Streptomyces sp. NPDC006923]|uniref:SH3 domain-containing protein n=1 Tax=Streptomyces sp. NPDC006923 TaxID=3155355 RepID=UPI0033EE6934
MNKLGIKRRVTTTFAVLVVAGSGVLAATPAHATTPEATASVSWPALPKGKVVSRITLNIREDPTTNSPSLGGLRPGAIVALDCKVRGQNVNGNNLWYLLADGAPGYVAARYVQNLSYVPYCED